MNIDDVCLCLEERKFINNINNISVYFPHLFDIFMNAMCGMGIIICNFGRGT